MPLQKNQILTLRIERLSSDGSGVAHSADGEAVFVPGTAPGDEARVRIVKDCGRYAFGILDELLTPSPDRIPVDCPVPLWTLSPARRKFCATESCRCCWAASTLSRWARCAQRCANIPICISCILTPTPICGTITSARS